MPIDVGTACIDRASDTLARSTFINGQNPANANGTIDLVCVYVTGLVMYGIEYAAFEDEGNNIFSTNGDTNGSDLSATPGQATTHTAPGDFTAFNINSGEYIGWYSVDGRLETWHDEYSGKPAWRLYEIDAIPCSSQAFSTWFDREFSIYATGVESGGPEPGIKRNRGMLLGVY